MSNFLNIFSKKPLRVIEKPKIIADYREKNSLVIAELISLGVEVEVKELTHQEQAIRNLRKQLGLEP